MESVEEDEEAEEAEEGEEDPFETDVKCVWFCDSLYWTMELAVVSEKTSPSALRTRQT